MMRRLLVVILGCGFGCGGSSGGSTDAAADGVAPEDGVAPTDSDSAAPDGPVQCGDLTCHADATCDTSGAAAQCACRPGFTGDGVAACVADCAAQCDLQIASNQASASLASLAPGSTVCLVGDARGPLTLTDAAGADAMPIVIRNCGGAVQITSTTTAAALVVTGHHFRITGSGTETARYGLQLAAPASSRALSLGKVHHFEVDRVEVSASMFAGFMIKRDPGSTTCQTDDRRFDTFVMQGVSLHDNYIHDVDGEGIYLGNSFYNGATFSYCAANASCDWSACDNAGYTVRAQYPHPVRGVRVYRNRIARTGWDAIQVGAADDDCEIYDNVVEDFGQANQGSQNHALQVGGGSSCRVYGNRLARGPQGLHLSGVGATWAYNNLLVDISGVGIIPNPAPPCGLAGQNPCDVKLRPYTPFGGTNYKGGMYVLNNTVVSSVATGRSMRRSGNEHYPEEQAKNNLFVIDRVDPIERPEGWTLQANVAARTPAAAMFVDPAQGDFHLAAGSPAIDAGLDLTGSGVTVDLDKTPRPQGSGFDCGAYERP
ncbi:MAG: choice-of-anchor Q domain-containing protein [Kofleriaceae bacterium]|nr:choice-of-anchor Q domain-containing protein [Kofleriaceae bacterium]